MKKRKVFETLEDSCGEVSLDDTLAGDPWTERIASKEYNAASEHPTPEQMLIRQAVKYLTPKQRAVWEYHNYDRLTQDKIGEKLHISHQAVCKHLAAIERRIIKYVKSHMESYNLLKDNVGDKE